MTHARKDAPHWAAISAVALATILLAGCSTGHIGETWQCPLAEGGLCDSVAAADPAVPDPEAAGGTMLAEPLWRVRDAGSAPAEPPPARGPGRACAADCGGGFDPLAWLMRLFGGPGSLAGAGGDGNGDRGAPEDTVAAVAGPAAEIPAASGKALPETEAPASLPAPERQMSGAAEPVTAPLPAEAGRLQDGPLRDDPAARDLRTGEVVARIWIAPFVDANGVYREGSWVRVVLEPAGWRLR